MCQKHFLHHQLQTKKIGAFKVQQSDHGQSKSVKISMRGKNPS
jgi:hypothetical protein